MTPILFCSDTDSLYIVLITSRMGNFGQTPEVVDTFLQVFGKSITPSFTLCVLETTFLFECKICVLAGADLANLFTETPNLFASETLDHDCFMDSPLTDAVKSVIVTLASSDRLFLVLSIVFLISFNTFLDSESSISSAGDGISLDFMTLITLVPLTWIYRCIINSRLRRLL